MIQSINGKLINENNLFKILFMKFTTYDNVVLIGSQEIKKCLQNTKSFNVLERTFSNICDGAFIVKIVNSFQPLTIFAKSFITDV